MKFSNDLECYSRWLMMRYPRKMHSHPELTSHCLWTAYQISGRNFFQVGDDVTTRLSKVFPDTYLSYCVL
ncbi:hypothetical protein Hanom_Chr03g00182191 [Helianthus anomalus]